MTRERCARISVWIAVPVLVFMVDLVGFLLRRPATEYLLVPPLAVIVYLLFSSPGAHRASVRGAWLLPVIGAVVGEVVFVLLGRTPWGVAVSVLIVLAAQRLLRTSMPPALAIAVLALLLRVRGGIYTLDVALSSATIAVVFFAWRHWLWARLPSIANSSEDRW